MTDDVRSKIEFAPQRERDALNEWVERVLTVLGHAGAFVTDESRVSDFLEFGGRPHRFRRGRNGPWIERPGDPVILAQNERLLASMSVKLGVPIEDGDLIVDIARRLRACAIA